MIKRSKEFDLGLDTARMKDPRDGLRQNTTVDNILGRFFDVRENARWEIQILADEVGMGKTFVALAVAYSLLQHMITEGTETDLKKCHQKVLVITPNNSALYAKWQREVSEFVKRCVLPEYRGNAGRWFSPTAVDRMDDLSAELRRSKNASKIIVANMSIFSAGGLRDHLLKRRYLLGLLFRYWGHRLSTKEREHLLKNRPNGWPNNPHDLADLDEIERERVPFNDDEILTILAKLEGYDDPDGGIMEELLGTCKELSAKTTRYREARFSEVEDGLTKLYRRITTELIKSDFPLVIVDEAHNWKNHRNGYDKFVDIIAPRTRRALLLTATPFQLHPNEILKVLEISDHISPCPTIEKSVMRRSKMRDQRENIIRPALKKSSITSKHFTDAWIKIPREMDSNILARLWDSAAFYRARHELEELASKHGLSSEHQIRGTIDGALVGVDPDIRQLLREALRLYGYNADLSYEMGAMVIRHRRTTEHRLFKVGSEYEVETNRFVIGAEHHVLHASPGLDVRGDGELPHYILMRCVSEMKNFKGRSSLGNALTGCYSTLLESQEGRDVNKLLKSSRIGGVYLDLLMSMVSEEQDPNHPKIRTVVDSVIRAWDAGEKSLIFCFRVNTAKRLKEIIDEEIRNKLKHRRERCLGGEEKIKILRGRLTSRERDLVSIGLDRVIWSFLLQRCFYNANFSDFNLKDMTIQKKDLWELARLALSFDVDLTGARVDRVFLNRSIEHILAKRLLMDLKLNQFWKQLFSQMSKINWVSSPYGLNPRDDVDDKGEEKADFDERGVHTSYEKVRDPDKFAIDKLAKELYEKVQRAKRQKQVPIIMSYHLGSSLWFGLNPVDAFNRLRKNPKAGSSYQKIGQLHKQLYELTLSEGEFDWETRRKLFESMRKILLRESVLLRLLPEKAELEQSGWGRLLVKAFFQKLQGQNESMADRINVFLEDLLGASGSLSEEKSARHFLYSSTRLSDQKFVALITGATKAEERERVFAGFNTPLLPEILICTAVGQEGIDLHRHCRHVVHYDLAWNPAVVEQRTGRADRIGSKTFRERALTELGDGPFLEIGLPYLAGTYDERMYEELRLRAQTFEVLTGGDLITDTAEGYNHCEDSEGKEGKINFVPLPEKMVSDLRVKLNVWS